MIVPTRAAERQLANLTFGLLVLYFPIETWASAPELWDPFYLVDLIGMILLFWGARRARAGTAAGVALLAAGYAWMSANGWRATFRRLSELAAGGQLDYGALELCFVVCSTALMIAGLAASLWMLLRASAAAHEAANRRGVSVK